MMAHSALRLGDKELFLVVLLDVELKQSKLDLELIEKLLEGEDTKLSHLIIPGTSLNFGIERSSYDMFITAICAGSCCVLESC